MGVFTQLACKCANVSCVNGPQRYLGWDSTKVGSEEFPQSWHLKQNRWQWGCGKRTEVEEDEDDEKYELEVQVGKTDRAGRVNLVKKMTITGIFMTCSKQNDLRKGFVWSSLKLGMFCGFVQNTDLPLKSSGTVPQGTTSSLHVKTDWKVDHIKPGQRCNGFGNRCLMGWQQWPLWRHSPTGLQQSAAPLEMHWHETPLGEGRQHLKWLTGTHKNNGVRATNPADMPLHNENILLKTHLN